MAWYPDGTWTPASTCFTGIEETALLAAAFTTAGEAGAVAAPTVLAPAALAAIPAGAVAGLAPAAGIGVSDALTAAGVASSVGGAATQYIGSQQTAAANQQQADYQSSVLQAKAAADRQQASQDAAIAQRQAIDERRKTQLVQSRLQAAAAASGGMATDPSTIDLSAQIAGQGEYNALARVASGQTQEVAQDYQAELDRAQAARYRVAAGQAGTAGTIAGAGTLFSGLGTLTTDLRRSRYLAQTGVSPGLAY